MTDTRLLTAYHEAAHTVVAYISAFHSPIGEMRLLNIDTGDTFVMLSRSKLGLAGKAVEATSADDPEVRTEFALILLAGLAAERHLQSRVDGAAHLQPDASLAANDYSAAAAAVGIEAIPVLESGALDIVAKHWGAIDLLARTLLKDGIIGAVEVIDVLDAFYGPAA